MFSIRALLASCCLIAPVTAQACDTALLLSIDVSNSVDVAEYRLQVDGMAAALEDPEIVEAMVRGDVAIAVMQWSGEDKQRISIPWRQIRTTFDAQPCTTNTRNGKGFHSV